MNAQDLVSRSLAKRVVYLLILPSLAGLLAVGQSADPSEVTSRESEPAFKLRVQRNLVLVRVVVRDGKGNPVANLRKEDFRLLDNGKPQIVTSFAVETPPSVPSAAATPQAAKPQVAAAAADPDAVPFTPLRFLALYFDDVHDNFEDLAHARDAADRYLASQRRPADRVGVFTSSGQGIQDFTDDLSKVHQALFRLQERPIIRREPDPCPEIFPYEAFLIVDRRDSASIESATEETLLCRYNGDRRLYPEALRDAQTEAVRVMTLDESQSAYSFRELEHLVSRMAALPGQRDMVFLSPGFFTETQKYAISQVVDRALRSRVVINTFDSKGLFAPIPLGDATRRPLITPERPDLVGQKSQNQLTAFRFDVDVLSQLAEDTGGAFFHNSNDYDLGFRQVGTLVETYYVLGFSPQNLKFDGRLHTLKVSLNLPANYTLQARRGYFAPRKSEDAAAQEKEDIEQAVFSQDELNGLPVAVHTQFFKVNEHETKLSILAHLDLRALHFRKDQGRNTNNLTFITALFDRDGKYVKGEEKRVELRLRDASLDKLSKSGIAIKTTFDIQPGTYLVREVVRDAEDGQMAGLNRAVEIPF